MPSNPLFGPDNPRRAAILATAAVLAVVLLAFGLRSAARAVVIGRLSAVARERGLSATWATLRVDFPGRVMLSGFHLARASADTVFRADSLIVTINPWSMVALRPRVAAAELTHARIQIPRATVDPDTLAPVEPNAQSPGRRERSDRLRRSTEQLVRLLLAPARQMPRLSLKDISLESARPEDGLLRGARLSWLELNPARGGVHLAGRGLFLLERPVPFELELDYGEDDRLAGGARLTIPPARGGRSQELRIAFDGRLIQDRADGVVALEDAARVTIGTLPFRLSGSIDREGPRVRFRFEADSVTERLVVESLPDELLGPLKDVSVRGAFDYRLAFDLNLERPDSVSLEARVIPHGLRLDPHGTRLKLFGLDQPFTAVIHLPRGRIETRELSSANPHFRPLDEIDSVLAHAVVTNEDGGFFRHRGFNLEAVKSAIAINLKAGAFRRGAGTITMQLARNLYLGHERTLARKAQEVVLAWVLEHLTGVSKRRLLEVYLNIIEWGPGIHGADEAARFYFDRDARRVTVDEALFLSTVVPAPSKWRYRFDPDGQLRPFARAQMHFIGRAMIAKGWLAPEQLPPAEEMRVELRGGARDVMFPDRDFLFEPQKSAWLVP